MSVLPNSPLVSIIVPVYNAELTILRCLQSIGKQSYANIEILIVDDCSSDRSVEITSKFISKNPNFVLLRLKENAGVSNARNIGLANAKGVYLMFVDADDYLHQHYLKNLVADITDADLVCSSFFLQSPDGRVELRSHGLVGNRAFSEQQFSAYLNDFFHKPYEYTLFLHCWNKLFKKSVLDEYGISFQANLSQLEDIHFVSRYVAHVSKICFLDFPGYVQCREVGNNNLSSFSGVGGSRAIGKFLFALAPLLPLLKRYKLSEDEKQIYSHFLSSMAVLFCLRMSRKFWREPSAIYIKSIFGWLANKRLKQHLKHYKVVKGESRFLRFLIMRLPASVSTAFFILFGLIR